MAAVAAAAGPSEQEAHVSHSVRTDGDDGQDHPQHIRPRILRRETSQILSYYQSADAGRSEPDPECRYPTPNPEPGSHLEARYHRSKTKSHHSKTRRPGGVSFFSSSSSSSSNYSEDEIDSETASVSDHRDGWSPGAGSVNGLWEARTKGGGQNGGKNWDSNRNEEDGVGGESPTKDIDMDTDIEVQYGIALGSPGGDALPPMLTVATNRSGAEPEKGTRTSISTITGTVTSSGYGSTISGTQFQSHFQSFSRSQLNHRPTAFHLSLPPARAAERVQSVHTSHHLSQPEPPRPPLAVAAVDSVASSTNGVEPDAAPGRRRQTSSRGAADKRRVAIVQMDTESEPEHEQESREGGTSSRRGAGTLSDGFGRAEGARTGTPQLPVQGHQVQQQALSQRFISVQPLTSSFSSSSSPSSRQHTALSPGAGSKSTAASALLARRGIVGTFALVAAPDASPSAYSNLGYFTPPPLSAPASAHPTLPLLARHESTESSASAYSNTSGSSHASARRQHQRSQSEAVLASTTSHGAINRSIPKAGVDANLGDTSSKEEKRRPGHRWRKSSRDIGIVGTTSTLISPTTGTMMTDVQPRFEENKSRTAAPSDTNPHHSAQLSPIFQTPSRSQTSLVSSDGASSTRVTESPVQSSATSHELRRRSQQRHTSEVNAIGNGRIDETNSTAPRSARDENKIHAVSGSDPRQVWRAPSIASNATYPTYYTSGAASPPYSYYSMATTAASSSVSSPPTVLTVPAPAPSPYLYYQPGVHATAGPLPSPPRQIIPPKCTSPPPPRPPRLHAPNSGSSSLAKRRSDTSITSKQERASSPAVKPEVMSPLMTPSTTSSTLVNSQSEDSVKGKGHTREGAFPVNSVIITDDTQSRLSVKQDQQEQQQALKRKTTMDELVRDVTAAIDESAGISQKTTTVSSPTEDSSAQKHEQQDAPKEQIVEKRRSDMDLKREESQSTFKGREPQTPGSPSSIYSDDNCDTSKSVAATKPLPDPHAPSPQPTSPRVEIQESTGASKGQKMLDLALKRFSALPRPPSRLSVNHASPRSSTSHERHSQDRSDNGHGHGQEQQGNGSAQDHQRPAALHAKVIYVAKIRSTWPEAMQFGDVLAKRSSLERSLGYARKINELANHDPGLGDWVVATKHNLTVPGKGSKRKSLSSGAAQSPSERSFTFQPRHSSRGSVGSEMTLPKRVDAYVATDLLPQRSEDDSLPKGPPPTLPYPTLAQGPPPVAQQQSTRLLGSNSTRSNASSLGSGKSMSGAGGFFASIGRKASVKKDRPTVQGAMASQPNKLLSKRQQTIPAPAPRPVQITASPSLPGGPRAPPGRVQRTQSVIAPKMPAPSESETERRRSIKRSPSVAASSSLNRDTSSHSAESSADIEMKVGKLADLLPHADKNILAGYLRRAGGMDMVAIGRYLDDEKNGMLIRG